jgi:Neuraminidase (sialidase)
MGKLLLLISSSILLLSGEVSCQIIENTIIYKKPGVYACFPNLFKAADGTLVATFGTRTSKSHYDSTGGSKTYVSKDRGHTWQPADKHYVNPVFKQPDGSIVIPAVNSWRKATSEEASKLRRQGVQVNQSHGQYFYAIGAFLQISRDGGKSWQRRELDLPHHALLMCFNISSYLRTRSGTCFFAVYGELDPRQKAQVFFLRSDDDGKTWSLASMSNSSPQPEKYLGFNETALAETNDGRIVAMMRANPDISDYLFSSVSRDGGRTWSIPQQTSVWGNPANLLFYKGKLICTYGYRRAPMGVRVSVFTDNFTKPSAPELILRSDGAGYPGHLGYPITVALGNGEFFTIYYLTTADGITHIAGTRWRLAN